MNLFNTFSLKYELWDTAGQERYRSLAPMYYRGARSCVIVFDITSYHSFEMAKRWVDEVKRYNKPTGNRNEDKYKIKSIVALVGNKVDLEDKRAVERKEVEEYVEKREIDIFLETSALTGFNIEKLYEKIGEKMIEDHPDIPNHIENDETDFILKKSEIKSRTCCSLF